MCYEDVKEGLRRYAKMTADPSTGTVFNANKNRVALKISLLAAAGGAENARLSARNTVDRGCFLFVNTADPTDEIWLERHGTAVQGEFILFVTGNCSVLEILNSELDHPPAPGNPYDSVSRSK